MTICDIILYNGEGLCDVVKSWFYRYVDQRICSNCGMVIDPLGDVSVDGATELRLSGDDRQGSSFIQVKFPKS